MSRIWVKSTQDNGKGTLREAIASAQDGDVIKFAPRLAGKTISLTSGQLEVSPGKDLVVDGWGAPGLTISGNKTSRVFFVNSNQDFPASLQLKNLTIANGYTNERGGGVYTTHKGATTIRHVQFKNNVADQGGGAIFSEWETTLVVNDKSKFDGNKATAANDERGAGAIGFLSPGTISVKDSVFINNQGINGAAINSLQGKLTIKNSKFINNSTTAAYYDTGKGNSFLRGYGGAVFADRASAPEDWMGGTIEISNSVFRGNRGRSEGGAVYLYTDPKDRVTIEDSIFKKNETLPLPGGGNGGNGGALTQMTNGLNQGLTIDNTTFSDNTAAQQGGGLWMMGAPTQITDSTFSGNKTLGDSYSNVGGAMALYGPTNIEDTTIANNRAGWVGGGISANDSDPVTVKDTIFYKNTADNGPNDWNVEQHTNRELTDWGGNLQYPAKTTDFWNDYNATGVIQTAVDPKLGPLQTNGIHTVGNPIAAGVGDSEPVSLI